MSGKKTNGRNTRYSQPVTHASTNRARRCLTSVIGREPVFPTWYGRGRPTASNKSTYTWTIEKQLLTLKLHHMHMAKIPRYNLPRTIESIIRGKSRQAHHRSHAHFTDNSRPHQSFNHNAWTVNGDQCGRRVFLHSPITVEQCGSIVHTNISYHHCVYTTNRYYRWMMMKTKTMVMLMMRMMLICNILSDS